MSYDLIKYYEPLDEAELSFLKRKEQKERSQYYKAFQLLMVMSFIIPFAGAWYRAFDDAPNAFSPAKFFIGVSVLLSISSLGTWLTYRLNLRKVQWDIEQGTKTIEINHIRRKQYMPQNNTYYFYIDSLYKLSIEVTQAEFYRLGEGDEISIEYTTHSKLYLGYF